MSHDPSPARPDEDDLTELVARTRGLQPWRRLFHLTNGVLLAWVPWALGMRLDDVLLVLAVALTVLLTVDVARLRAPGLNAFFFRAFRPLASPREATAVASSTWYLLGVLLTYGLFPLEMAVPAILVLGVADPAASFVGRSFGHRKVGKGTVIGALAFFVAAAAVLVGVAGSDPATSARLLGVALAVTALELAPIGVDDNLTIPVATAAALTLVLV